MTRYRLVMAKNGIANKSVTGEKEWRLRWTFGGIKPALSYYRVFSHYIGESQNIVPEDILHDLIEPVLNSPRFTECYADKNIYDKQFPKGYFPNTIFRRMSGLYYDATYHKINLDKNVLNGLLGTCQTKRIVIKPTVDGISGYGIKLVEKNDNGQWLKVKSKETIDVDFFSNIGRDFIVQEAFEQSDFISQFNPTSTNTIRLSIYKSVKDDKGHLTGAIMRIGGKGSVVDNAHAGGYYVGIMKDGTLRNKFFNQYGESQTLFNGIDLSKINYKIPNWDYIVRFGERVTDYYINCRLLALDVVLDKDNQPHLLEVNVKYYSPWLFQFTQDDAFGEYTDEIIQYCKDNYNSLENIIYI